jgi:integrase
LERLAKELLLATATRKSDAIRLGPANLIGNELHILHTKNDSGTILPVLPELRAALDSTPTGPETFLVTQFGKPYSSTGFYNWFKRACVKAGVGHCSPHGLRKAMSRRLAESGATVLEGRSVTGHKTDKEFARYAEKADQRKLSRKAMANLPNGLAKEEAE